MLQQQISHDQNKLKKENILKWIINEFSTDFLNVSLLLKFWASGFWWRSLYIGLLSTCSKAMMNRCVHTSVQDSAASVFTGSGAKSFVDDVVADLNASQVEIAIMCTVAFGESAELTNRRGGFLKMIYVGIPS